MPVRSRNVVDLTRQSPPIDLSQPYDPDWVSGKTILITGGASGFGENFFRKWAAHGANVIIGDINDKRGIELVQEVRASTGNKNHHYIHCDVTIWQSQVDFFHQAVKLSPTGGIDSVVANAGINGYGGTPFWDPQGLDADSPPPPDMKCLEVNLIGVTYTVHLALFYLARNPNSAVADHKAQPAANKPDRHLLLIGSIASLATIPGLTQYNASKHGVLGLFKSLRSTAFMGGLRINIVLPYFVSTPLLQAGARVLLAGSPIATPEDVVDAGTRFMADTRIVGRALMIGPKIKVRPDNDWEPMSQDGKDGMEVAVREVFVDDFEEVEAFCARLIKLLNVVEASRGLSAFLSDMAMADKSAKPNLTLIPWDPESEEHRDRLYVQRVACGWKYDRIDKWCKRQRDGSMSIHWVVLDPSEPKTAERIAQHIAKHPKEATPLQDSAVAVGGRPRDSSSSRLLEPFMPVGHISVDTVASTPEPTTLLADPANHRYHLSALYISSAIQGGGIGSATMEAAEHMAATVLGATVITLDTWDRRLITDDSKKEWREKFEYYSPPALGPPKFDPQGWYQRLGYKVIKEIEEFDERSGYCLKREDGKAWCIPSVYMEKAVE
ncbi:hypothetical protein V490_03999 [Pseudogymnoascus sp. VKM F-3557]|nr:hypothetical protein V490_03999 [Pseudogymnoascus sp. VKM F-3557]